MTSMEARFEEQEAISREAGLESLKLQKTSKNYEQIVAAEVWPVYEGYYISRW